MYLQPLKFAFSLYRLTWQIMGGIATGIYRGVQQRRVVSLPVSASVSVSASVITIDLSPTEVEQIVRAESIHDAVTVPDLAAADLNEPASFSEPTSTGDRSQIDLSSAAVLVGGAVGEAGYATGIGCCSPHSVGWGLHGDVAARCLAD